MVPVSRTSIGHCEPERRNSHRYLIRVPIRVRALNAYAPMQQVVATMNLSRLGVFFATDMPLREGHLVEICIRMPREVAGDGKREWRFTGRVAHVERATPPAEKHGVGVQFLYYEPEGS